MADIEHLIIRLGQGILNGAGQSNASVMQQALDALKSQAQTITDLEARLKARDERIETLLILKDGYYDAMHAWRTSAQDGVPVADVLARRNSSTPALRGML